MISMPETRRSDSDGGISLLEPSKILAKAEHENFPVAARFLSRAEREQLLGIYGFARFVDDTGDLATGDRLAQLDAIEARLDACLRGAATDPLFARLAAAAAAIGATREPFVALIDANRQDQIVRRYATIAELESYCALSANPVGHLVLKVFGADTAATRALSDRVCTGLQLIEHLQDVGEDYAAGRVYLPGSDLAAFGVDESSLGSPSASDALRRLVAFECGRARDFLDEGLPLVARLSGRGALAVAGFVGGGQAQLEAIEQQGFDVLARAAKASKVAVLRRALAVIAVTRR
jgi:squalene synthase HpnC